MRKLLSMALLLCLTGGFALAQTPTIERILNESSLIDAGAKLDIQDDFGRTALRYAISHGDGEPNTELAEALIRAGADVNLADNDGDTPLTKSEEVKKILKEAGAK